MSLSGLVLLYLGTQLFLSRFDQKTEPANSFDNVVKDIASLKVSTSDLANRIGVIETRLNLRTRSTGGTSEGDDLVERSILTDSSASSQKPLSGQKAQQQESAPFHLIPRSSKNRPASSASSSVLSLLSAPDEYEDTTPSGSVAVLLFTATRPAFLQRTLTSLMKILPHSHALFISQDGSDTDITRMISAHEPRATRLQFAWEPLQAIVPAEQQRFAVYYRIAQHYRFGFSLVFDQHNFEFVIILEGQRKRETVVKALSWLFRSLRSFFLRIVLSSAFLPSCLCVHDDDNGMLPIQFPLSSSR